MFWFCLLAIAWSSRMRANCYRTVFPIGCKLVCPVSVLLPTKGPSLGKGLAVPGTCAAVQLQWNTQMQTDDSGILCKVKILFLAVSYVISLCVCGGLLIRVEYVTIQTRLFQSVLLGRSGQEMIVASKDSKTASAVSGSQSLVASVSSLRH